MSPLPRSPTSLHPTRQQLDELDELMQRMLLLPVDEPPPIHEAGLAALHSGGDSGPLLVEDHDEREAQPDAREPIIPQSAARQASVIPPPRLDPGPTLQHPDEPPASRPGHLPGPLLNLPPLPAPAATRAESANAEDDFANISGWLTVVVWCNYVFDLATMLLGPVGRWLRSRRGRTMLGWLGVGLLAAAVAWGVLDWIGWTW